MTHHADSVVRTDVKGWLGDLGLPASLVGKDRTQRQGQQLWAELTNGCFLLLCLFVKNLSLGCTQVLNLGVGEWGEVN